MKGMRHYSLQSFGERDAPKLQGRGNTVRWAQGRSRGKMAWA